MHQRCPAEEQQIPQKKKKKNKYHRISWNTLDDQKIIWNIEKYETKTHWKQIPRKNKSMLEKHQKTQITPTNVKSAIFTIFWYSARKPGGNPGKGSQGSATRVSGALGNAGRVSAESQRVLGESWSAEGPWRSHGGAPGSPRGKNPKIQRPAEGYPSWREVCRTSARPTVCFAKVVRLHVIDLGATKTHQKQTICRRGSAPRSLRKKKKPCHAPGGMNCMNSTHCKQTNKQTGKGVRSKLFG